MSAELAVPGEGPLPSEDVAQQVRQLRQAATWISSGTESEALDAKRRAELAREWVRIHKASKDIAIEACRLQATALRRLCQLHSGAVKGMEKSAGDWLASLPDHKFNAMLAAMTWPRTPISLYNASLKDEREDRQRARGEDIANGAGEPLDWESVSSAANDLLHRALSRSAVTVNEMTEELAERLGFRVDGPDDYLMRQGIETVVREALRNETFEDGDHPDFVTWKDQEAGWLRIPWPAATLNQLRWMADYRHGQAQELQKAADELSGLVESLTRVAVAHPRLARLSELWRALLEEQGPTTP